MDMKEPNNNWERRLGGRPPMKNGFTSDLERKVRERIRMKSTAGKSAFSRSRRVHERHHIGWLRMVVPWAF